MDCRRLDQRNRGLGAFDRPCEGGGDREGITERGHGCRTGIYWINSLAVGRRDITRADHLRYDFLGDVSVNQMRKCIQYPLQLAYAITVHKTPGMTLDRAVIKTQGMTLDRAVIAIGEKEMSSGLTFVAISWVKSLQGLAFRPGFPLQRIMEKVAGNLETPSA